jgi:hypothetical protein
MALIMAVTMVVTMVPIMAVTANAFLVCAGNSSEAF